MIKKRLEALRKLMSERNIDIYMVPTSDFHQTEAVGSYFKAREFMSGFTGSEGILVVTMDEAALWVDGRYFIQAEKQLKGSTITKMEMDQPGVPTIEEYIVERIPYEGVLGFDGRVVNAHLAMALDEAVLDKMATIACEEDLVGMIWEDRPSLPTGEAWLLTEERCGESSASKIEKLQTYLEENNCDMQILSTLDDIAWLTNMRGSDVENFPVVLAFMVVTPIEKILFMDENKLSGELAAQFEKDGIEIRPYEGIYEFVAGVNNIETVLVNLNTLNYKIYSNIHPDIEIIDDFSPTQLWKACKNEVELENTRNAHIKDCVAQTKFIYWLKQNVAKGGITEISAAEKLLQLRQEQEGFIDLSFETISAYMANAAAAHYHPTADDCAELKPEGFYLVDSGGHYCDGSTDTTRTIVLGPVTDQMKLHFTAILRGMIRLSKAKFLYGCNGRNLDILCRGVIWDMGLNYRHGTGHGVGHLSTIHEEPNGFRWKEVEGINDGAILEVGMVTSNEPALYFEGEYGIRTENEIVVQKDFENEFGQFMKFETLTFVPIDREAIDKTLMTADEIQWLNEYHAEVYSKISPYLTAEEAMWLKEVTAEI